MKCPLAIVDKYNNFGRGIQAVFSDCLKKDCAWWNQDDDSCSIVSIANALGDIWDDIRCIEEGWGYIVCELGELIRNEKHRRGIGDENTDIL
jgi:hypothetical protein